jgi:hypothetical protein
MALKINNKSISSSAPDAGLFGLLIVVCFLASAAAAAAAAQGNDSDADPGMARLFANDSLLLATIEAPLTTLMKERPNEEYLDGKFTFIEDDGTERSLDLKIRTRGKFRRKEKHCNFAPIRLNFRKKQVVGTEFAGQDKLKLVTHCQSGKQSYEQLVLREFLAYRFLNELTNNSFGVRLVQINYVDTEGANPMTKLGFVIEDVDDVAGRSAMRAIRTDNISSNDLDRRQQNLINVFQYMIGNTEYSLTVSEPGEYCCHNTDLMSATEGPPYTPLAYDFDFSGLVNAPYAAPNPRYKIQDVRQRLYKGSCGNNDLLPETLQHFLDTKDAIYNAIDELDELELLSSMARRSVTQFVKAFYDRIAKPKTVNSRLIEKCYEP